MKRAIALITLIIAVAMTYGATPTVAQTNDDVSSLIEFIQQNEELLVQARELVLQTSSVKARSSLQAGTQLHNESKKLVDAGIGDGRYARAAELARRARETLLQTISIARREAKIAERAQTAIERASFRLDDARQRLSASPDSQAARKLSEEAHGQLQRAEHNMREHLYESALRLAISSNELSERAIALLKGDIDNPDALLREIEKTDRVIERVGEQVTPDSPQNARQLLDEAQNLQLKAKEQVRGDRPRAALDMTRRAREMAMRAMRLIAGTADRDNVEQALHLTDVLVGEAQEIAAEQSIEALSQRVAQAEALQDKARMQFIDGNHDQALKMTLRAREILKDALARVKKALNRDEVLAALEQTDALLSRAANQIAESNDDTAKEILARAQGQQDRAWNEFRNEQLRAALTHSRLARNLAQRALRQAGDERT